LDVKDQARVVGFDDGPFTFDDDHVALAGVMTRGGGYVEAVFADEVTVDGTDATHTIEALLAGTGFEEAADAILVDGGTVGGFNVVDLDRLHEALGLPAIAITREPPDDESVRAALDEHFDDAEHRHRVLTQQPVHEIDLGTGPAHIRHAGGTLDQIEQLLQAQTVRGREPEPVRIAHLVATATEEGASRGQ